MEFHENPGALNQGYLSTEDLTGVQVTFNPGAGAQALPQTKLDSRDLVITNAAVLQVSALEEVRSVHSSSRKVRERVRQCELNGNMKHTPMITRGAHMDSRPQPHTRI